MPGSEQSSDDPSVANDCRLYRRIPPTQVVRDSNSGLERPSSASFTNGRDGSYMSVVLGDTLARDGRQSSQLLENYPGYRLVSFTAEFLRSLQQGLIRAPTPDEPAHGGVTGPKPYSVRKKMSQKACWENGSHATS